MLKNTNFFKLGPYSRKNNIRTGTGPKLMVHGRSPADNALGVRGHARGKAPVAGRMRAYHTRSLSRSRGSPDPVWLGSARGCGSAWLAGDTCHRLAGAALLQPTVDACPAPVAALRRSPADPFFFSSLSFEIHNTVPFSDFHIFRSVDRIDMIPSTKF